jgi:hypothetical protein
MCKYQNTLKGKVFFVFSEAKNVFLRYIKLKKPEVPLFSSPSFFDIGGKEVLLLLRILLKVKKVLGQQF